MNDFPENDTAVIDEERPAVVHSDEAPAPGNKVITLAVQGATPTERKSFRLHKERIVIGSVVSADVRLSGEGVSPIHAVVELADNGSEATVYDLASDTGVFVNSTRVVSQTVKGGDKIRVGKFELLFKVEDLTELLPRERTRESEGRRLFLDPEEDFSPLLLEEERDVYQIFDYSAAQKRALQVVMSWRGTILEVEHFVKEKSVTVGPDRKHDFGIPPLLSAKKFAIVQRNGEDFVLNIDPQMQGVMQRKGRLDSLDELRAQAKGGQILIGNDDFAKVSIGEVDFYLSYTAAPPRLKMGRLVERDPLFFKIFFGSMAMTVGLVFALIQLQPPQQLEAEQLPERIATILYQPEKYVEKPKVYQKSEPVEKALVEQVVKKPEPPKPHPTPKETVKLEIQPKHVDVKKPVPKEMNVTKKPTPAKAKPVAATHPAVSHGQNQAKEGEGARVKGKEGTRGSKTSKVTSGQHQDKANRPAPQGGKGAGAGNSQVQDEGNVDFLKDATGKIENILGNSAAHLGKGGEKLKGFGGFTTQGSGGLALSGNGSGGGGTADTLTGGLGNKGRGGGRVGTGMGAAGSGNGIIGGKTRVAIRTGGPEEAVVMGSIDADAVEAALLAHRDEFRLCYEKEINAENPDLAGRVGTTFVIGSTGRVTQAGIESSTLKNANAERCILNVIRRIDFPIPRGAGVVQVTYPFKFNPVGH